MQNISREIIEQLKAKNLVLSCAESITGGMVASAITTISGASACFSLGVVSYTNEIKHAILGVSAETLAQHGAISAETAREMAQGAMHLSGSDIAVATTGIAGPSACEGKPVGLAYIAVATRHNITVTENNFIGDRNSIQQQCAKAALLLLQENI